MPRPKKDPKDALSERITVAFKPELKRQLDVITNLDGITFNSLINRLAEKYCTLRVADISEYDTFIDSMRRKKLNAEP